MAIGVPSVSSGEGARPWLGTAGSDGTLPCSCELPFAARSVACTAKSVASGSAGAWTGTSATLPGCAEVGVGLGAGRGWWLTPAPRSARPFDQCDDRLRRPSPSRRGTRAELCSAALVSVKTGANIRASASPATNEHRSLWVASVDGAGDLLRESLKRTHSRIGRMRRAVPWSLHAHDTRSTSPQCHRNVTAHGTDCPECSDSRGAG